MNTLNNSFDGSWLTFSDLESLFTPIVSTQTEWLAMLDIRESCFQQIEKRISAYPTNTLDHIASDPYDFTTQGSMNLLEKGANGIRYKRNIRKYLNLKLDNSTDEIRGRRLLYQETSVNFLKSTNQINAYWLTLKKYLDHSNLSLVERFIYIRRSERTLSEYGLAAEESEFDSIGSIYVKRLKGNCIGQSRMQSECKIFGKRIVYNGLLK